MPWLFLFESNVSKYPKPSFLPGSNDFRWSNHNFNNSLDPDQAQQNVKSNLDRNRLAF